MPTGVPCEARAHEDVEHVVHVTLDEFKRWELKKLHTRQRERTLDWAIDEHGFDQPDHIDAVNNYDRYVKAIEKLANPPHATGKRGSRGKQSTPQLVLNTLKGHCKLLGIRFENHRLGDLIKLLAAIQSRT